jgi:hypothetical protein
VEVSVKLHLLLVPTDTVVIPDGMVSRPVSALGPVRVHSIAPAASLAANVSVLQPNDRARSRVPGPVNA